MKTDICKVLGVKEDEVFYIREYCGEYRVHNNKLQWNETLKPYEPGWRETLVKVDDIKDKRIIKKHKTETTEALGAIARSLKKIAKEMKKANEPLEPVYTLTEKGKALVEQHKNECEEVSDIASKTYERYSKCKNRNKCYGRSLTLNCTICDSYEEQEVSNTPSNVETVEEAISILKNVCKQHKHCNECKFYNPACRKNCILSDDIPMDWEI